MELDAYVDEIRRLVEVAADAGGDDARAAAEQLIAPLDAAVRLAVQHALADAAEEITCELAPGSVELRVRGREPGVRGHAARGRRRAAGKTTCRRSIRPPRTTAGWRGSTSACPSH